MPMIAKLASALLISMTACGGGTSNVPAGGAFAAVHGHDMYYETHGDGPPLLLLHGGTGSAENWAKQVPAFSRGHRVILPEQTGHGRTADRDGPIHYHDMAEDTVALMDRLHIQQADLVGWSDGGVLALDISIHHPERVRRVAMSGANFTSEGINAEGREELRHATPEQWPRFIREAYDRLSPDGPEHWPIIFAKVRAMWLSEPTFTTQDLGRITAPTLVVAGEHDVILPAHSEELARSIPAGTLCIFPGASHMVPLERPDDWNAVVLEFLEDRGSDARTRLCAPPPPAAPAP